MNKSDSTRKEYNKVRTLVARRRYAEAYERCLPLAEAGATEAQTLLGWMFRTGNGVAEDHSLAKFWLQRAADKQSAEAQFYLAADYLVKDEFAQAVELFERSAFGGYVPAIYHLGRMYRFGVGVPSDPEKSAKYVHEAAAKGHLFAKRDVARELMQGKQGLMSIPRGIFLFVWTLLSGVYIVGSNPDDLRAFRL